AVVCAPSQLRRVKGDRAQAELKTSESLPPTSLTVDRHPIHRQSRTHCKHTHRCGAILCLDELLVLKTLQIDLPTPQCSRQPGSPRGWIRACTKGGRLGLLVVSGGAPWLKERVPFRPPHPVLSDTLARVFHAREQAHPGYSH